MKVPQLNYAIGERLIQIAKERGTTFCQLGRDESTERFLERTKGATPFQLLAHSLLRFGLSHYDANAILDIYPLHLLSPEQLGLLLSEAGAPKRFKRALDIGTGDGTMARNLLAPIAHQVQCTEMSKQMAKRVHEKGLDCFVVDVSSPGFLEPNFPENFGPKFDLISILNVLDRTKRPQTLLDRCFQLLEKGGFCIISTPLPMIARYYDGPALRVPEETLGRNKNLLAASEITKFEGWELEAFKFLFGTLQDFPVSVRSFSRVPYISGGDLLGPFVTYDDICVVCQKK